MGRLIYGRKDDFDCSAPARQEIACGVQENLSSGTWELRPRYLRGAAPRIASQIL